MVIVLLVWGGCAVSLASAAEESLAVIVPSNQSKVTIGKSELAAIYGRRKFYWEDGTKIQPVNLPANSSARRIFSLAILGYTPAELEQYWNDRYFHGVLPPYVLSSDEAVLRFVSQTPGAIGYVPYCAADKRVAVVLVIGANGHVAGWTAGSVCPR